MPSFRKVLLLAIAAGLGSTSCQGLHLFEDEAPLDPSAPYGISILETGSCPLPPGVDAARMRILGLRVRLRAGRDDVPANFFYASVLTNDENRYLAEHTGCTPVLSGRPLRAGEVREGYLNFPLPLEKSAQTLVYAPLIDGLSEKEQTKSLALGPREADTSGDEDP